MGFCMCCIFPGENFHEVSFRWSPMNPVTWVLQLINVRSGKWRKIIWMENLPGNLEIPNRSNHLSEMQMTGMKMVGGGGGFVWRLCIYEQLIINLEHPSWLPLSMLKWLLPIWSDLCAGPLRGFSREISSNILLYQLLYSAMFSLIYNSYVTWLCVAGFNFTFKLNGLQYQLINSSTRLSNVSVSSPGISRIIEPFL